MVIDGQAPDARVFVDGLKLWRAPFGASQSRGEVGGFVVDADLSPERAPQEARLVINDDDVALIEVFADADDGPLLARLAVPSDRFSSVREVAAPRIADRAEHALRAAKPLERLPNLS